jgi:hypothetical protein
VGHWASKKFKSERQKLKQNKINFA